MTRRSLVILFALLCLAAWLLAMFSLAKHERSIQLRIFHAGSLSLALSEIESVYESLKPSVEVLREPSGSVRAVRKISDLGKNCDIVMVADYRVIDEYLVPDYADWSIAFCTNEVVLCYTEGSAYADEVGEDNWYEILMRPGIKYGFSNPNLDPCGYRALSILYMASVYYGDNDVWEKLVLEYITNIRVVVNESGHFLFFPAVLEYVAGGKLVLRDKSVDLIQLLEAGVLDYAFEYKSVAEERGVRYVRLPPQLNLASDPFLKTWVILYAGDPERQRRVRISEIRYGLTVPKCCNNCEEAVEFLKWFLYGDGMRILEEHGFTPIPLEYRGAVPSELRG